MVMSRMVKIFTFIFIIAMLCLAIIIGACLNYNSRIDKLEMAIGNKLQPNDSVGFQSYVDKFDIQSNWFILYVTLLFGIFAIFGYTFIVKIVDGKVRDVNKQVSNATKATDQKNKEYYEKYAHELKDFMSDNNELKVLLFVNISNYSSLLGASLEKEGDLFNAFRSWIDSAKYLKMAKDLKSSLANETHIQHKLASAYELIRHLNPTSELAGNILQIKNESLNELFFILKSDSEMVRKLAGLIIVNINLIDDFNKSNEPHKSDQTDMPEKETPLV